MKVYLAGPLFSLAEQNFNRQFAQAMSKALPILQITLPQERADSLLSQPNGFELVFQDCIAMVRECDALVAVLDGPDVDSGTCIELGYAYSLGKPIVGVRTDFRVSEDRGMNLMVSHVCGALILETRSDLESLARKVCEALVALGTPAKR